MAGMPVTTRRASLMRFHPARLLREELHEVLEEVRALHVAVVVLVELREEPGLPAELQHLRAVGPGWGGVGW